MTLAGLFFVLAGGFMAYPAIRDATLPPPTTFGEEQPVLRPTVTPLPSHNQIQPSSEPPPAVLPETPLLMPGQAIPTLEQDDAVVKETIAQVPTRIVIPAIDLDAPIETMGWSQVKGVSTWDIPDHFAAGWLKTSRPLGQPGNTVLDGHHNTAGEVFRDLVNLKPGDVVVVYAEQQRFSYEVVARHILLDKDQPLEVRRRNATWIKATWDERLTLVTCWPYSTNTHRLIIVAKPLALDSHRFAP